MSGMGRDVHGHPPGGEDRPQQLRRPADPSMDELSKRMNKMEPYGNDCGRYYNPQHGMEGQMPHPPRPAPSAGGWSSGENHFSQQDGYAYQQQMLMAGGYRQQQQSGFQHPPPVNSGWNPGASEFVPKSNLGVCAQEFVPRQMPRNTSHWAYQQQQQTQEMMYQQQQQQQDEFQQHHQPTQPQQQQHLQGRQPYDYRSSQPSTHHVPSVPAGASDCMYDPRDALTDAIATIILMPHKFERTSMELATKINNSVQDAQALAGLTNVLVDSCLKKKDFRSTAGRFCDALAQNVTLNFNGVTFKQQFMDKFQNCHGEHVQLLSSNAYRCRNLLVFATDLYLHLLDDAEAGDAGAENKKRVRSHLLLSLLYQLLTSFLTLGKNDKENLIAVSDVLKLSGAELEEHERQSTGKNAPEMDQVIGMIQAIAKEDKTAADVRTKFNRVVEIRSNGWKMEVGEKPDTLSPPEAKPQSRKKGSNAIAIVQPPSEPASVEKPRNNANSSQNSAPTPGALAPEDQELTEEELRFMSEQMGDNISESDGMGPNGDNNYVSDGGSEMPDDVEAAYLQFLDEQQRQQNGSSN